MKAKQILFAVSLIPLALYIYQGPIYVLAANYIELPALMRGTIFNTFLIFTVSLTHAIYTLGWRHTLAFLLITFFVCWGYEQIGVETSLVYGSYYYTDYLGPKLGHVPLLIPIAWFMMIYPSYIMANLIGQDCAIGTEQKISWVLWLSVLSAFIMTAWDLIIDPVLTSNPFEAWVWTQDGIYFHIPAQNFIGWLLTTFTVYLIYRILEIRWIPEPMLKPTRTLVLIPLIIYASLMIDSGFSGFGPKALPVIAIFVMGIPLLMAFTCWLRYQAPENT
ncbi:MAG: carotenoid biosynthesis protein [Xenococcaceae cyanobacterium MO_234.B1]|nr:carotenoid biosynthesis protein [Xenococcaceae cyanobacterium MO_234.B1]